jgi:hypothetical protein
MTKNHQKKAEQILWDALRYVMEDIPAACLIVGILFDNFRPYFCDPFPQPKKQKMTRDAYTQTRPKIRKYFS